MKVILLFQSVKDQHRKIEKIHNKNKATQEPPERGTLKGVVSEREGVATQLQTMFLLGISKAYSSFEI